MTKRPMPLPVAVAAVLGSLVAVGAVVSQETKSASIPPPAATKNVDFTRDIQPIFTGRCLRCHGPKKSEGGLRLDRKAPALTGGNSGPVWEAGNSAASRLIRYVAGLDKDLVMPPTGKPLSAAEIGLLRAWIDQGAKWPDDKDATADPARSDHWAFQRIQRPPVPRAKNAAMIRNPIDNFIFSHLDNSNLSPSPEADRGTLIRRLTLDLLGLPPTVAEVDAFLADSRPSAYERLLERLLASQHYGERWARHWLDVARYADSDGYNADSARPIWKYRDWVIDAFNQNMPFDRFVIEQLAGDLLPKATLPQKIATGFHRNTLFNAEGGNDPEEFRVERVVDRVATTGVAFLGLTIGCAECHAHKYDPISQREFYEMYAFFNNAEEITVETPTAQEQEARSRHRARVAALQAQLQAHEKAEAAAPRPQRIGRALLLCSSNPRLSFASVLVATHLAGDPARQRLLGQIALLSKQEPRVTVTLGLSERAANPRPTRIHVRGNFRRPGASVIPGVPRVLPAMKAHGPPSKGFTRLDLAHWLVSRDNPLTARVTVNRVWQRYFGVGLVETENDFGAQGKPPSHPELLDWLAAEFMDRGWNVKDLHRLIVSSAAYRQSSNQRKELAAADPNNRLLGRQSRLRLEAETVRDVLLAASGLLSNKIGGPSVFPYQPPGVMETRRSRFPWVASAGADRYRRGMYTHFWRTSPHPFLMTFDAPTSDSACTRRHRSNTPLQALMLLNDPVFVECARGLAKRVLKESAPSDSARTRLALRLCLAREPTANEQGVLNQLLTQQRHEFHGDENAARKLVGAALPAGSELIELAAWTAVARVLLNLDEVITRE